MVVRALIAAVLVLWSCGLYMHGLTIRGAERVGFHVAAVAVGMGAMLLVMTWE